jgi:hypothetical protein
MTGTVTSSLRQARRAACLLAFAVAAAHLTVAASARGAAQPPSRVVAVGDTHGDYDSLRRILQEAGLVDAGGAWTGGEAVLVQTGDYLDRGEKVHEVLDWLMALEPQARAAGGRLEVLLGNHEGMNLVGDFRDVNRAAYAHFADDESEARRTAAYDAYVALARARASDLARAGDRQLEVPPVYQAPDRAAWMAAHPPGFVEYVEAFGPKGKYGKWLRARPATVKIDDTVFVHGGFTPETAPKTLEAVNDKVESEIKAWDRAKEALISRRAALPFFDLNETLQAARATAMIARANAATGDAVTMPMGLQPLEELGRIGTWFLLNPNSPLWTRVFATWKSDEGRPKVEELAARYKASRFVVGHTPLKDGRIAARFGGRVLLIDTGMLSTYYTGGRASALEIAGNKISAIYGDGRMVLADAAPGTTSAPTP